MMFKNAKYTDKDHKSIYTERTDGTLVVIPADPANRDYRLLMDGDGESGIKPTPIADYIQPAPKADDVRGEAERRMIVLLKARNVRHLAIRISNQTRETIRLLLIGQANWTAKQKAQVKMLTQMDTAIEAIHTASNKLETSPPVDFADDKHWP